MEEEKRICSICGEEIEGDNFYEYDGEIYCADCFDENFVVCADCGETIPRDDAIWVESQDKYICESCYENDYFTCDDCGEIYPNDYKNWVDHNDRVVCDSCRDDNYYYCEDCDEYVHYSNWNNEYDCCEDCASEKEENGIFDYHDSDKDFQLYDNGENPKWYIGFELETGNNDTKQNERDITEFLKSRLNVEFERDGSIGAYSDVEIISHPQSLQYIYGIKDKIKECFEYLVEKGYKSHDLGTCGLHLHFSRLDNIDSNEIIARGWLILETFKDQIIKISGRKTDDMHYFRWLSDQTNNYGESIKAISKLKKNGETTSTRYLAINNTNDKTIEFRFNRGTLNFKTFMARIEFANNLYEIMTNIDKNIEEYRWADLIKGEYISEYAKEMELENVNIPIKDYSIEIIQKENELKAKINKAINVYTKETHKRIRAINAENIITKDFREMCDNMQITFTKATYYSGIVKTLENILNEERALNIQTVKNYIDDKGFDDNKIKNKIYAIFNFDNI